MSDVKIVRDAIVGVSFSIGALLLFYIPTFTKDENINGIISYALMSVSFFYFIYSYKLPTLKYFRLPEFSFGTAASGVVVAFYSYKSFTADNLMTPPLFAIVSGLLYIILIGIGEELVSRGFIFGIFRKYGVVVATVVSADLFGLMHLNLYLGKDWDPYRAYWHVIGAFGFGLLCAVMMVVSKSIYLPMLMHTLYDWSVAFEKPKPYIFPKKEYHFAPLWQTIKDTFADLSMNLTFIAMILIVAWVSRAAIKSRYLQSLLYKFKLVELEGEKI